MRKRQNEWWQTLALAFLRKRESSLKSCFLTSIWHVCTPTLTQTRHTHKHTDKNKLFTADRDGEMAQQINTLAVQAWPPEFRSPNGRKKTQQHKTTQWLSSQYSNCKIGGRSRRHCRKPVGQLACIPRAAARDLVSKQSAKQGLTPRLPLIYTSMPRLSCLNSHKRRQNLCKYMSLLSWNIKKCRQSKIKLKLKNYHERIPFGAQER